MKFYRMIDYSRQICRSKSKILAERALGVLLDRQKTRVEKFDVNDYNSSTLELNLVEGKMILGVMKGGFVLDLINENRNAAVGIRLSPESIQQMDDDILSGKTFFKDGHRAKKLLEYTTINYSSNMTFWIEDDLTIWVTFPTDKEAVEWLLYN